MPPKPSAAPTHAAIPLDEYDRDAIYAIDGPISPCFVTEAVRVLMRSLPLDTDEPAEWVHRRMYTALIAVAALVPRDEIELMLAVHAIAAHQAANTCWYLGMNMLHPRGDSTRHISAAGSALRAFDTALKALERRQARPLVAPFGRPPSRVWQEPDPSAEIAAWKQRVSGAAPQDDTTPPLVWTEAQIKLQAELRAAEEFEEDYGGLDLANIPGIQPDGSMVVPKDPTDEQHEYLIRRFGRNLRNKYRDNLRAGNDTLPPIRPVKPGDLMP